MSLKPISEEKDPSQFWEVNLLGSASGEQFNNTMSEPHFHSFFYLFLFLFEVVGWVVNSPDPCSTLGCECHTTS